MRKRTFCPFPVIFFIILSAYGQQKTAQVEKFSVPEAFPGEKVLTVPVPFGSDEIGIEFPSDIQVITRIQLVYTSFRVDPDFKQDQLNRDRIRNLQSQLAFPEQTAGPSWEFIAQTGARTVPEAKGFFHGFVIHYRPIPAKESIEKEIAEIKKALASSESNIKFPVARIREMEEDLYDELEEAGPEKGKYTRSRSLPDATFIKVMDRHPGWNEMMVVTDVTGSMSPYLTQLVVWHKMNRNAYKVKRYVFFNDGDLTPDRKKKIGSTGGIYIHDDVKTGQIQDLMFSAMRKGYGGDCPENNVEALIKGLNDSSSFEEILMIADNFATPRDLALLGQVNKPVRIIICGGWNGINPAYLDLARKTGGSVHTMEEDIERLAGLNEGEIINILGQSFMIRKGEFVRVNDL